MLYIIVLWFLPNLYHSHYRSTTYTSSRKANNLNFQYLGQQKNYSVYDEIQMYLQFSIFHLNIHIHCQIKKSNTLKDYVPWHQDLICAHWGILVLMIFFVTVFGDQMVFRRPVCAPSLNPPSVTTDLRGTHGTSLGALPPLYSVECAHL